MLLLSCLTIMAAPQTTVSIKKPNKVINHSCGHMKEIPVSRIPHDVVILLLRKNQLTSTDGIQKIPFSNLKLLDFSSNQLVDLKGLREANLDKVIILTFFDNKLTSLADMPSELPNLEELYLTNNQLTTLDWPENINLPNLKCLLIADNQLTNLEGLRRANMPNLVELNVRKNPLTTKALLEAPWEKLPNLNCLIFPKSIDENDREQIEQAVMQAVGHHVTISWGICITKRETVHNTEDL